MTTHSARLVDEAGVDLILVGDSVANTVMGLESTVPVTLQPDDLSWRDGDACRSPKARGCAVDMPFGTASGSDGEGTGNQTVRSKYLNDTGADAVKIEGGKHIAPAVVEAVVEAGIPVVGHVGLMPQYRSIQGGLKVQGRELEAARQSAR